MQDKLIHSVREQIAEHIRSDVFSGVLSAGELLREMPLAKRFGVSRGPVRDVLLQLSQEGLLVFKPNIGVKVSSAPDERIQPLVVHLRQQIELFALELAFENIQKKDIVKLAFFAEHLRSACEKDDLAEIAKFDMEFHRYLVGLAGNKDLLALWLPITVRMMLHYTRHKDMLENYREHTEILNFLREKKLEKAKQALLANIQ